MARYHPMLELLKAKRFNLDRAFYKGRRVSVWIEDMQQWPRKAMKEIVWSTISTCGNFSVQLYPPKRPLVDIAEVFLRLMASGTILSASYWSAWSAREAANEQDKLLKDASDEFLSTEGTGSSGMADINTTSAVLFVVIASCFLVMLYKFISFWFVEVLVVLFRIGGVEGLQTCLVALLSCFRWFEQAAESFVKVPFFGAVSYLTLAMSPFCIAFAIVWAVFFRRINLA